MSPEVADELHDLVSTRAAELGVPGVAVGVVGDGFEHLCCVGHPTPDDPRPVGGDTLFQIGSVSKPITSLLVGSLYEDGALDPDTRLTEVLGETGLPDVTIEELLSHRFGLDGDALLTRPPDVPTPAGAVAALVDAEPLGTPGADFTYSNAAYSVLGRVVEVADERPFAESLRRRLLRPLRMRRTVTTADEAITGRVALPHQSHPEGPEPIPGGMGWQPRWELGAHDTAPAGMISCVDDLVVLMRFVLGLDEARRPPLSSGQIRALWEPLVESGRGETMASGWLVRTYDDVAVIGHPGVTAGYCTLLSLVPERRFGWAALTNGTAGGQLHDEIDRLLLDRLTDVRAERPQDELADDAGQAAARGRFVGGLGVTTVLPSADGRGLSVSHEPRDDGRWQPFPNPPAEVERRGDLLVGTDAAGRPVAAPLVVDGNGRVEAIRWGRRLRLRDG